MQIIPAIELKEGCCVSTAKGAVSVVSREPEQFIKFYTTGGSKFLQISNLDTQDRFYQQNRALVEKIIKDNDIAVFYRGKLDSLNAVKKIIGLGVEKILIPLLPFENSELIQKAFEQYGEKLIVPFSIKGHKFYGGQAKRNSHVDVVTEINKLKAKGIKQFQCVDLDRKGTNQGVCFPCLNEAIKLIDSNLYISGGIAGFEEIKKLSQANPVAIKGFMITKSFMEGNLNFKEIMKQMVTL